MQAFCGLLAVGLSGHQEHKTTVNSAWIGNIVQSSPLHDIGKVAIPDRILLKPGPLTPDEFAIMKTHASLGAQTLKAVHDRYPDNELIGIGIEIARSHHEWWDGTGYPDGLAGEETPLCARILAVADCYDAIRSIRCYKPAIPHDEACAIILRGRGKHFDPAVTAVFSELADAFREVCDRLETVPDELRDYGAGFQPLTEAANTGTAPVPRHVARKAKSRGVWQDNSTRKGSR